jgi:hypothetical protein
MQFRFVATEAGSEEECDFLLAQAACQGHYLTFQRSLPVGGDEDWGIYVEFDDQSNAGYEKIARCFLSRRCLRVEFTEPIDWQKRYSEAVVELQLTEDEFQSLVGGLRRIFSQKEELLSVQD